MEAKTKLSSDDTNNQKNGFKIPTPTTEDKYVINKYNQESITKFGLPIAVATCSGIFLASRRNFIKRSGFQLVPFYIGSCLMSIFTGRLLNRRAMAEELMMLDTPLGQFLRGVRDGNYQQKQPAFDKQTRSIKFSEPVSKSTAMDFKVSDPYVNQPAQNASGRKNKYGDDMVSE